MIKNIAITFIFLATLSTFSQIEKLNNYNYVIVADKFEYLKSSDEYQTSSLTKFLLKKNGFEVFLSNEKLPTELFKNRCLALMATVVDDSNMFTIKSYIEFKDCFENVVYTTEVGKSKQKEYKKGYQEAIRRAHETLEEFTLDFQPSENVEVNNSLEKVTEKVKPIKKKVVENKEIPVKKTPIVTKETTVKKGISSDVKVASNILYAQATDHGFQLIDTTPAVIFQILKTKNKDVFIIKDKNGTLYKNGSEWTAQYYEGNTLVEKQYIIKF
ncbi:hypothetical protein [Polaribacter sp.]|uniref:hypothetical protein n=1 Tax=Polaribacter sp. TaxID=1920175 RepID=UPI003EF8A774